MPSLVPLADIADYHGDAEEALRLLFSGANPNYTTRFATYLPSEVNNELVGHLDENGWRSSLITLARVEAALRVDYQKRGTSKLADSVSVVFRRIYKSRKDRARLEDDIIKTWYDVSTYPSRATMSQLRSMFKFRHWLAHGRHWTFGHPPSFQDVYVVADAVINNLPLLS